jgi:hypothetical protein
LGPELDEFLLLGGGHGASPSAIRLASWEDVQHRKSVGLIIPGEEDPPIADAKPPGLLDALKAPDVALLCPDEARQDLQDPLGHRWV